MADKDNRYYPRSQVHMEMEYKTAAETQFKKALSHDLSASGLSFESDRLFSSGTELDVRLFLKEINKTIPLQPVVVRSWEENGQHFTSVKVTDASEDDFVYILDYSLAFYED